MVCMPVHESTARRELHLGSSEHCFALLRASSARRLAGESSSVTRLEDTDIAKTGPFALRSLRVRERFASQTFR
eukprot:7432217-Alexandrium_andersonii.AAC.1